MRRYPEAAATLDRALVMDPADQLVRLLRADLELYWRADTKRLHEIFEDPLIQQLGGTGISWLMLALCERDAAAAERALPQLKLGANDEGLFLPGAWYRGLAARARGDETAAKSAFADALVEAEKGVAEQPNYGPPLCVLGLIHAALGRKEEAIHEGRRARELVPMAKDAVNGTVIMQYMALIYAWTAERDLAIEQIVVALQSPGGDLNGSLSYGLLRLHPNWDPLRGDPRFEKLVASLAPKAGE